MVVPNLRVVTRRIVGWMSKRYQNCVVKKIQKTVVGSTTTGGWYEPDVIHLGSERN